MYENEDLQNLKEKIIKLIDKNIFFKSDIKLDCFEKEELLEILNFLETKNLKFIKKIQKKYLIDMKIIKLKKNNKIINKIKEEEKKEKKDFDLNNLDF